ncbi:Ham1 family [Chlamydia pecorum IPTaLE]|nr:Ham1 family [Chlamydia pecorum IPTaLE]
MDIIIASSHGYKIRETKAFLKRFPFFDIFSLVDFPHYHPPQESGETTEKNALAKAVHAAQQLNAWAIADDTMLRVPALHGLPGPKSAVFAGEHAYDKEHREKLLKSMSALESPVDRSAYFECSVVLASPHGEVHITQGICEGYISHQEKGSSGCRHLQSSQKKSKTKFLTKQRLCKNLSPTCKISRRNLQLLGVNLCRELSKHSRISLISTRRASARRKSSSSRATAGIPSLG